MPEVERNNMSEVEGLVETTRRLSMYVLLFIGCLIGTVIFHLGFARGWFLQANLLPEAPAEPSSAGNSLTWQPPDAANIPGNESGVLIRYGRELIEHTALYLGPKGKIAQRSNGMNCQNCHLEGGTKPFAANYSAVAATYPKYRKRSGTVEGFEKRINDCFERSLNGSRLDDDSREMKAIIAYLQWVGVHVKPGTTPEGHGLKQLPLLNRAASPEKGKTVYGQFCARCHGEDGEGIKADNQIEWKYPPLWGSHSYNTGAGLFRISKFAAFVKANMPYGISFENPLLTDEEAWDVAAYVNSMPRPHRQFPGDWPVLSDKPMDHPFGPYADRYSEKEHKYGPFSTMKVQTITPQWNSSVTSR